MECHACAADVFVGAATAAAALDPWSTIEGSACPLGVTWVPEQQACNFALYARHATSVTLLLYSEGTSRPLAERRLDPLNNARAACGTAACRAPTCRARPTTRYRVDGPRDARAGHRFDPEKVLLDPYARGVFFPPGVQPCRGHASPARNAGRAPLGVLPRDRSAFDWRADSRPRHTHDLVIYEMHVRGFTQRPNSGVPADRRGTFAGVIDKIPYLKELGVTAVELLPVHQFDPAGSGNYWGYMPLSFFAPHQQLRGGAATPTAARRVPRDGAGAARGRHRGHPRRRLQPHRRSRRRRARPTAIAASTTARTTCSTWPAGQLSQRHRNRQRRCARRTRTCGR